MAVDAKSVDQTSHPKRALQPNPKNLPRSPNLPRRITTTVAIAAVVRSILATPRFPTS
jgi:hypothetical protein